MAKHSLIAILLATAIVSASASTFEKVEASTLTNLRNTPLSLLTACVKDEFSNHHSSYPIPFATAVLTRWSDGQEVTQEGENMENDVIVTCFQWTNIPRGGAQIKVKAANYYTSLVPVNLFVSADVSEVDLGTIFMTPRQDSKARLIFGGDVMFDRRFFEQGILNLGDELERESAELFRYIQPHLKSGDHTNVNLECPMVEDSHRSTPHPNKTIVFGCHRESAQALPGVGIDSVTIANNHLYDYLEAGTNDTMRVLDDVGLPWFGGGMTRQEARDSFHRFDAPLPISLQGFTNFYDYSNGDAFTTFADVDPVVKGGAMPAFEDEMEDFIKREIEEGRIPIPVIHGGKEYSLYQSEFSRHDFQVCALAGAKLVIAHHPHVVHGISTFTPPGGSDDPYFVVGSLGNLVFDQQIHETYFGYLAVVDMNKCGVVDRLELVPFFVEGFIPRPLALSADPSISSALARATRWIAHMSTIEKHFGYPASSTDDSDGNGHFSGAVPYFEHGKILVAASEEELKVKDIVMTHTLSSSPESQAILIVHEDHLEASSLASLAISSASTSNSLVCDLGVDRLRVGGFEVNTVGGYGPDDYPVPNLWQTSESKYLQSTRTRSGLGAAVLVRSSSNSGRTSLSYGRRVDVVPGSNFTLQGFFAAENAGRFEAVVSFTNASYHETVQEGDGIAFSHPGGNVSNWTKFQVNVQIPMDTVEIEAYFRQYPPSAQQDPEIEGRVFLDDISFIEWDANFTFLLDSAKVHLATPNGWEFVRCACRDGDVCGDIQIDTTGRTYESRPKEPTEECSLASSAPGTHTTMFAVASLFAMGLLML